MGKNNIAGVSLQGKSGSTVGIQAFFMSLGTLTSRILGLVRESLFAALFPREITDAWYVAFKLPNLFRRLFGEGSLSVSLIPILVQTQRQGRDQSFFSSFFYLFTGTLLVLTVVGIAGMETILYYLLDQEYLAQKEKWEVTVHMGRIMFGYVYLVCSYALALAVLNTQGRFGWPAVAPALFNLALIGSMFVPIDWQAWPGQALAWGVIVGGVVQVGLLIPFLIHYGYFPRWQWQWSSEIKEVFVRMLPSVVGMGLLQMMTLVNVYFASQFPSGIITYMNFADRILELPLSLISVSIGSALLPQLSRLWQSGDREAFVRLSVQQLRLNLFLSLGAALGMVVLAEPIVELLFQRGKFTAQETQVTAQILRWYGISVVFASLSRVFVPNFYAVKNTWWPALVSGICLIIHVFLAPQMMHYLSYHGLIISTSLASFFNFILLVIGYRFFIGRYDWVYFLRGILLMLPPLIVMFAVLQLYQPLRAWLGDQFFSKVLSLSVIIVAASISYFFSASLVKLQELDPLKRRLLKGST